MAVINRGQVADIMFYDRETGESLHMGQTVSISMEAREAEPEPIGATEGNTLGGTLNLRTEQPRESRSIAMGTMERQFMEKEEEPERITRTFSRSNRRPTPFWEAPRGWGVHGDNTWIGGDRITTGTLDATHIRVGDVNTEGGSIQADTIAGGTLNLRDIEDNGELDIIGELPAEGLRAENIRYEELEPVEVPVDGQLRTAEGLGEWSNSMTFYAYDGEILPEPVTVPLDTDGEWREGEGLGTERILFQNGSEITGFSMSSEVEEAPTLPSSYMGDASHIVERINQEPVTEQFRANRIDLNGQVTFSDLSTNAPESSEYTSLSTERITNEAIEAVRRACEPFIGQRTESALPETMACTIAEPVESGTWISVPQEGFQEWRTSDDAWISQGIYENEVGNGVFHKGCWFFGDQLDNIEGTTVHSAFLTIKKCFSVGDGDTKVYVVGHPHKHVPTTEPYVTKVSVLKTIEAHSLDYTYIDLEPFKELISKGLIKGFGVYTEESGLTEFASFDKEAELEITWY